MLRNKITGKVSTTPSSSKDNKKKCELTVALQCRKVVLPLSVACLPQLSCRLVPEVLALFGALEIDAGIVGEALPHLRGEVPPFVIIGIEPRAGDYAEESFSLCIRAVSERSREIRLTESCCICRLKALVKHFREGRLDFLVSHCVSLCETSELFLMVTLR